MAKLPALQFYPGDWKKDIGVQSLDLHHRGLWFEMLLLMHDSDERGKLVLNGRPMNREMIARAVGLDIQTFNQNLTKLLEFGVASLEAETGTIYSRRMVRDEKNRLAHAEAGKKGGNPRLVNQIPNQTANQNPTPSFSSSTSIHKGDKRACIRDLSAVSDLVKAIVCAHPRAKLKNLSTCEVSQRDEIAVLEAMQVEMERAGCSEASALTMILQRTGLLADKVPRERWKYFRQPQDFYRGFDYRQEPEDFLSRGATNGKVERGGAAGRVERNLEGLEQAIRDSGDYAPGPDAGGNGCVLPAPGDSAADVAAVPRGVQVACGDLRPGEPRSSVPIGPAKAWPKVLPPSDGNHRGVRVYGQA